MLSQLRLALGIATVLALGAPVFAGHTSWTYEGVSAPTDAPSDVQPTPPPPPPTFPPPTPAPTEFVETRQISNEGRWYTTDAGTCNDDSASEGSGDAVDQVISTIGECNAAHGSLVASGSLSSLRRSAYDYSTHRLGPSRPRGCWRDSSYWGTYLRFNDHPDALRDTVDQRKSFICTNGVQGVFIAPTGAPTTLDPTPMPTVSPSIHAEGSPTAAPTQLSWRIVRQTRGSTPVNVTDACHVDAGCISDGEGRYGAREACTFEAVQPGYLRVDLFDLEGHHTCNYDDVAINGIKYCGGAGPGRMVYITAGTLVHYHSDTGTQGDGFEMCLVDSPPGGGVPTPAPVSAAPTEAAPLCFTQLRTDDGVDGLCNSLIDVGVDVREICSSSTAENITEACFNAFAGMFEHIGSATLPYQYYDGFCNGVTTEQESLTDECAASVLGFVNSVAPGAAVGPSLGILCNPGGASPETPRPVGECDYSAYDGGNTNPYTDEWCKATCDAHERGCTGYSRRTRICFIHHTDVETNDRSPGTRCFKKTAPNRWLTPPGMHAGRGCCRHRDDARVADLDMRTYRGFASSALGRMLNRRYRVQSVAACKRACKAYNTARRDQTDVRAPECEAVEYDRVSGRCELHSGTPMGTYVDSLQCRRAKCRVNKDICV